MINADKRVYEYFTYDGYDTFGQPTLSKEAKGSIKMAVNIVSQSVQDNPLYKDSQYIGIVSPHIEIDDTFVIAYGEQKLKVLYVNPKGRFKQVFMRAI